MLQIGKYNTLKVVRAVDFGLYLDAGEGKEVLLPARYVTSQMTPGAEVEVFVYNDSEDRPVATTERPRAVVGEFAYLRVKQTTKVGAFLDWGLPKDLLVPFSEQKARMRQGGVYLVYVYLDDNTNRVVASARIERFIGNKFPEYQRGKKVQALVYSHLAPGYRCIVDNLYHGIVYDSTTYVPLETGATIEAYVDNVRDDGKIDLMLMPNTLVRIEKLAAEILKQLEANGGSLSVSDKSPSETIAEMFYTSKKDFKKALGKLYKDEVVNIYPEYIELKK